MPSAEQLVPDTDLSKHSLISPEADHVSPPASVDDPSYSLRLENSGQYLGPSYAIPKIQMRRATKNESIVAAICQWIVDHQIGLSANLILLHALTHLFLPRARVSTRKCYQLSYFNIDSGKYALGWDDIYIVIYSIIVLTGLRAATMDYLLEPLARLAGIVKKKDKIRFAEQAWVIIYDTTFWSLGMYIMYHHEHWMNLRGLWSGWPDRELEGSMKIYYLIQFAFWLQQILVVNIEQRRKDHWQMFTHHIITCILMFASYSYHHTKVGNTILCLMDVVDLFLAFAKILKYLQFKLACDIAFGVFMVVWIIARHFLYLKVVYSIYYDLPSMIDRGCYSGGPKNLVGPFEPQHSYRQLAEPFLDPEGVICWNDNIKMGFVYALLALQVILLLWFGMIMRVAMKVLRGGEAEDSRSDDEEEAIRPLVEKLESDNVIELPPLQEEVGVEGITLASQRHSPVRRFRKGGAASGRNLHSDRKELLGRIGCDKGA